MKKEARATLLIEAPMHEVWRVLTDFPRYGEWNPFLVSATPVGEMRVGLDILLRVRWPSGGEARARDRFTTIVEPSDDGTAARLDWHYVGGLDRFGLLHMRRCQLLTPTPTGVRYETWEQGSGLLSAFAPYAKIEAGFAASARALKSRCEAARQRAAS